jgi:enoyl-[acyl-carrier-protein] reductase (NADH)
MTQYFLELGAKVAITSGLRKLKIPHQNWKTEVRVCLQCDVRHYEEVENMLQSVLKALAK